MTASLLLAGAVCCHAQEFRAITNMVPPIKYEQDGKLKGVAADVLQELCRRTGHTLSPEVEYKPLNEAYAMVRDTRGTVLPALALTPQREPDFKWVGPVYRTRIGLISKKSSEFTMSSIALAKQHKIATVIDSGPERALIKAGIPTAHLTRRPSTEAVIRLLADDQVDMIAFAVSPTFHVMLQNGIDPNEFELIYEISSIDLHIAFNRQTHDDIIDEFQTALEALRRPGPDGTSAYDAIILSNFMPFI